MMLSRKADDIQSLRIGIEALQLLNVRGTLTTGELATALSLSRAQAYRILKTLAAQGYIVPHQRKRGTGYRPSVRVHGLSDGFDGDVRMLAAAQPLMLEFTGKVGWPLSLSTPAGDRCFVRYTTDHATSRVLKRYSAGVYGPALYSAAGLVCLADKPPEIQASVIETIQKDKPPSYARVGTAAEFMQLLAQVRRNDYATYEPNGERENAIAVPLRHGGVLLAALTLRYMRVASGGRAGLEAKLAMLRDLSARIELRMEDSYRSISSTSSPAAP
jgi:IclR family mhp operon transcriptional activator